MRKWLLIVHDARVLAVNSRAAIFAAAMAAAKMAATELMVRMRVKTRCGGQMVKSWRREGEEGRTQGVSADEFKYMFFTLESYRSTVSENHIFSKKMFK